MPRRRVMLLIETSNPGSGPSGPFGDKPGNAVVAGPGVGVVDLDAPDRAGSLEVEPIEPGSRHSDELMPAIATMFTKLGLKPGSIERIAVSAGPGGYTGVRIAVTTAKAIAEAMGAPVLPVPSPLVAAAHLDGSELPALVVSACKGSTGHGVRIPDRWDAGLDSPRVLGVVDAQSLSRTDLAGVRTLVADEHVPGPIVDLARERGMAIAVPIYSVCGLTRIAIGSLDAAPASWVAPETVLPIYAREPEAVTRWRARHAR